MQSETGSWQSEPSIRRKERSSTVNIGKTFGLITFEAFLEFFPLMRLADLLAVVCRILTFMCLKSYTCMLL